MLQQGLFDLQPLSGERLLHRTFNSAEGGSSRCPDVHTIEFWKDITLD